MKKKYIIIISSIIGFVLVVLIAFFIYVGSYYRALDSVNEYLNDTNYVSVTECDDYYLFEGDNATKGFVFYPGGLVEAKSYAPFLHELASNGYLCVLLEVPFNLAVFDINAADGIVDKYDYISEWYISGHSLGGSMAASFLEDNLSDYKGLILLGSYSTVDFSNSNLKVLSIYGENDLVLNKEKYEENKINLPSDYLEVIIEGGNHAYFGMYGNQKDDGIANITNMSQIDETVRYILEFVR